ncbi:MAG: uncharacterized protein QOJ65_1888 [Fimbriimonadaceae bacterium]|jgi:alpha-beta hydrolase superfamily lysophospholipase|nr:uncharacterized protein [Fimbriimonadaceae bacterium]
MLLIATLLMAQAASKEITFKGADGFELNGTLLIPKAAKPVSALLLLPGSGPMDRDENVLQAGFKTDVLKQIAERLAQEGVATLRFDKRAVAHYRDKWPKDHSKAGEFFGWDKFVGDAKAGYDYLRAQPEIDPSKVGLLGHSEGSLISLQIASDLENTPSRPAGLVLLAGNGRTLDVVLLEQLHAKLPKQAPADQATVMLDYAEKAVEQIKKDGTVPPNTPPALQGLFNPSSLSILRSYFITDPIALAKNYSGDVLIVNGEFDNQVSPERDAQVLYAGLRSRPKGTAEIVIIPGASHGLKATTSIEKDAYEGPVLPQAIGAIATWANKHLK